MQVSRSVSVSYEQLAAPRPQSRTVVRTSHVLPASTSYTIIRKAEGARSSLIQTTVRRRSSSTCWSKPGSYEFASAAPLSYRKLSDSDVSTAPSEEEMSDAPSGLSVQTIASEVGAPTPYPFSSLEPRLSAAACTKRGKKHRFPNWPNQDVHMVVPVSATSMVVGVFDGHGLDGHKSASCVCELFRQNAKFISSLSGLALIEDFKCMFRQTQAVLEANDLAHYSGTTVTVAVIDIHTGFAVVAHVGDSTLVVFKDTEVAGSTRDHRVDEAAEQRIRNHGGEVRTGLVGDTTTRRIYHPGGSDFPGLAMARCLGDQEAQQLGASHEPEFSYHPFCPGSTVVVASDGVWDMLTPNVVASHIAGTGSTVRQGCGEERVGRLASTIVTEARSRYDVSKDIDDITAVVVQGLLA